MVSFVEKGKVDTIINGKVVEQIDIETEVTVKNVKTNQEYALFHCCITVVVASYFPCAIAKLSVNSRALLIASCSLLFHTSATLLSNGSSGLGALNRA